MRLAKFGIGETVGREVHLDFWSYVSGSPSMGVIYRQGFQGAVEMLQQAESKYTKRAKDVMNFYGSVCGAWLIGESTFIRSVT